MRRQETEAGHGHLLRVTAVEQPRGKRVVVLRKVPESEKGRPLLNTDSGQRLTVAEDDVPELRKMLERVENGEV